MDREDRKIVVKFTSAFSYTSMLWMIGWLHVHESVENLFQFVIFFSGCDQRIDFLYYLFNKG